MWFDRWWTENALSLLRGFPGNIWWCYSCEGRVEGISNLPPSQQVTYRCRWNCYYNRSMCSCVMQVFEVCSKWRVADTVNNVEVKMRKSFRQCPVCLWSAAGEAIHTRDKKLLGNWVVGVPYWTVLKPEQNPINKRMVFVEEVTKACWSILSPTAEATIVVGQLC